MKRFALTLIVLWLPIGIGCGWCRQPVVCCPQPCAIPCTPVTVQAPTATPYVPAPSPTVMTRP